MELYLLENPETTHKEFTDVWQKLDNATKKVCIAIRLFILLVLNPLDDRCILLALNFAKRMLERKELQQRCRRLSI
jgi:hypothetical protein